MNRRRILLSYLANSFSWELYSKTYFYNELVPTTINSKNVLNKAKIVKVSGNGVIENQLVNSTIATQTINGVTFTNNGDGSWTVNGTATANTLKTISANMQSTNGHYYLLFGCATGGSASTYRLLETYTYRWADTGSGYIQTASSSGTISIAIEVKSGTTCNNLIFRPQFVDLTLREGTGNEPTTLTDNRIQNILNRGYIAYNLGEYKESDIGVVSSEPYNLWNNILEDGFIDGNGSFVSSTNDCRTDYIAVIPSRSYVFGNENFTIANGRRVFEYDENKNFIKNTNHWNTTTDTITLTNNTRYVAISYNGTAKPNNPEICIHLNGTRTGYAEHKTFTPITFKAQLGGAINSHDTMEITNSEYVFTRNVWKVDLGSLSWYYRSSDQRFNATLNNCKETSLYDVGNIACSKYTTVANINYTDKTISLYTVDSVVYLALWDGNYTSENSLSTALSGTYAYYELATPQVISIPRKHLGIVKIRDLSWGYTTANGHSVFYTTNVRNGNNYSVYCSLYLYDAGTIANNQIRNDTYFGPNYLYITDDKYTNTADFLNECGDYLIFYETENEVADIENVIDIESGGTITTDSEVLPNIELSVKCK